MDNYKNKVAVITGAASGIGKALAEKCAREQMKIVLSDINEKGLLELEEELKNINGNVVSVVTDVSKSADVKKLAYVTLNTFGKVHLLFNNAGVIGPVGPLWEVDIQAIEALVQTNLMGVIYVLHEFLPRMLSQSTGSHIINTASGAGLHTSTNILAYSASKHAVVALSEVLYYDLKQKSANIKVSVLCPGLVNTAIVDKLQTQQKQSPYLDEVIKVFQERVRGGVSPCEVAEQTFKGISSNQFYILTELKHKEIIQSRMEDILENRSPSRSFGN